MAQPRCGRPHDAARLAERDPDGEVIGWLRTIAELANGRSKHRRRSEFRWQTQPQQGKRNDVAHCHYRNRSPGRVGRPKRLARVSSCRPCPGTHELFSGTVQGPGRAAARLEYPAVCNLNAGKIEFDNYGGRWGDQKELDRFLQAYAVEKAKIEARRKGYSVTEQPLVNGSIKLTVQVGGAA